MNNTFRTFTQVCLTLTPLLAAPPSAAVETAQRFDIPAQPLADALLQFSEESGVKVFFSSDTAKHLKTAGVSGSYTPAQALNRLLAENDLDYRYTQAGAVTIEPKPAGVQKTASNGGAATLPPMRVTADNAYDPHDPYDKRYAVPNAQTATKTDTPIMETPVSIQVVPRAVLDDQQAISVGDALKNVSGVQPGGYSFYDNFILRGFDAGQNTYRNGLRQAFITGLETANLERIEVLKGPAGVLFGRIEPGGLINLATKRPLAEAYYSVQQQFGSFDLYRTTIDATGPVLNDKTLLYRMNIAYKDNDTFRDFIHQERVFVAPSLTWKPNDRFESHLDIEYQHDEFVEDGSDSGIPALGRRPADIPSSRYFGDAVFNRNHPNLQDRVLLGLDWSYRFNDDWNLTNRFQYLDAQYHQSILWSDGLSADNRTINRGLWNMPLNRVSYGTNLDLTGKFDTGFAHHDVLAGFDLYRLDERDGGGFSDYNPAITPIDLYNPVYGLDLSSVENIQNFFWKSQDSWYGVYFQDQITLWDKLHILGGGRQDWAESGNGFSATSHDDISLQKNRNEFFSPRVGILYQPWQWLSLYGNYVESISSNNFGRSASGRPFDPQYATQYEAGIKTEFFDGRLNSTLAYYHITKQNLLATDPNNPLFSVAIGEARSQGVEFDLAGRVTESVSLIGTYAYTDAIITQDGAGGNEGHRLASVPRHSGSLWAKYDQQSGPLRGLNFGSGVYVRGQREGDNANSFELPGYVRWDASAGYSFNYKKSKITTQLNVYNLLDKTYYDHSSNRGNIRPGEPLTLLGSVRIEF
jgi:iron complex outermembrane receptor protein